MQNFDILIVGGGVAGLTCAGLLKKHGVDATIIEKEPKQNFNSSGYMLGILPLGGRVMTELDLEKPYFDESTEMNSYEIHKENGDLNKAFSLDYINKYYGSYRGIEREKLIDILMDSIDPSQMRYDLTITSLHQKNNQVDVGFSGAKKERYDLIIIADGLHSQTRKLIWKEDEYGFYDTQWGGWVAWLDNQKMDTYKEYWGASSFIGLYPVKDKIGVFVGGPNKKIDKMGFYDFLVNIRKSISSEYETLHEALSVLSHVEKPYYWEFHDSKTDDWKKGNVILLGDAACGFLPTAGVGASMAMDSAAALVDELSRTDKNHVKYGLNLYVSRQKERVEKAQKDSRNLGKIMFVKSKFISNIRDFALQFYTLQQLTKNISETIEGK